MELGNLNVSREFNDVNYVCEIYKELLECHAKSEIVNICSNIGIKLLDVIDMMNKLADYEISVKVNPKFVRKDEISILTGSTTKLFELIGNKKQKNFKDTLRDIFEA